MSIDKSKFKVPSTGNYRTQSLFIEYQYDPEHAVYSLSDQDREYKGVIYPSLKRAYLDMEDVGEYEFATTYFLSWKQWERIASNEFMVKHVTEWREELELKIRGKAIGRIVEGSKGDNPSALSAAKWLADSGWVPKKRGRPSKEEKAEKLRKDTRLQDEYASDVVRLRDGDV